MIILGTNSIKDTGYDVANSLRFNDDSSDYLSITPGSSSNTKKWTFSCWIKLGNIKNSFHSIFSAFTGSSDQYNAVALDNSNRVVFVTMDEGSGGVMNVVSNAMLRDPSAWYHIVTAYDSAQATDTNRVKGYINGTQVTSLSTSNYPAQDKTTYINSNNQHNIGKRWNENYYDGYMAEVVFIDGLALDPTSFGEFDSDSPNIWKPKDVSGLTFGTNGFYLDFEDSSALGNDAAGSNNFTVNNLTAESQSTDTCTLNYATMNSLAVPPSNAPTFAEGNTKVSTNNSNANPVLSTIGVSQGKWYVECKRISYDGGSGADDGFRIGFGVTYDQNVNIIPAGISNSGHYFMIGNGIVYNGSTDLGDKAGDSNVSDNGVVGIALDLDNNRISWSFNGAWMTGSGAWSGSSPSSYVTIESGKTYFFLQNDGSTGRAYTAGWNFGGTSAFSISSGNTDANGYGNFETAPPSGYYALNTKNLSEFG